MFVFVFRFWFGPSDGLSSHVLGVKQREELGSAVSSYAVSDACYDEGRHVLAKPFLADWTGSSIRERPGIQYDWKPFLSFTNATLSAYKSTINIR